MCRRRRKPPTLPANWPRRDLNLCWRATVAEIDAAVGIAEFLVCYPSVKISDEFFRAAPRIKLMQLLSAGYDDVDLAAARRAGVPVANNGGANSISVAEHTMMLMLAVSRRVIWQHANVSGGRWRGNGPAPRMYEMFGKTLGIVGLGTIGKKVARLAHAFGMQVQYYDIARLERKRGGCARCAVSAAQRIAADLRRDFAARPAQQFHARHDRRRRAFAAQARGHPDQYLPRAGRGRSRRFIAR